MLQAIVRWSLHNRAVVVVLVVLLLGAGFYAAGHSRLDVFPEFAPPPVVVQTEAPGLSPNEVERLAEVAGQLPTGVRAPRMAPLTATTGRLVTVGFTSDKLTPMELRDRVQW